MGKKIDTVEQAVADIKQGKIVMVIDDPDRENEGDFICATEFATPENINFMATHGKGLICMPMSKELCQWWNRIQITTRQRLPYLLTGYIQIQGYLHLNAQKQR